LTHRKNLEILKNKLAPVLSESFGYFSLLYTQSAEDLVEDNILVRNQITLVDDSYGINESPLEQTKNNLKKSNQEKNKLKIQCKFEELPVAADCIDLVFLPEILQESQFPHQVLREAERVMIPDGTIILIINNPIGLTSLKKEFKNTLEKLASLFKLRRSPNSKIENQAWYILGKHRIKDWLNLLGIETTNQIAVCRDYVSDTKELSSRSKLNNKLKQFFHQTFADQIIIVGKKKVSTLTPIRPSWRNNKRFSRPRFAEPSVQQHAESCLTQITK